MLYVVPGPPTAGKSSWIDARAKPTDIVIDLDRITRALAGPGAPQWIAFDGRLSPSNR